MYHILPRSWLRKWRKYMKDPKATLPPLDNTVLLCHMHGQLIVPPHLEEYLLGARRSLLSGLGQYKGEVS